MNLLEREGEGEENMWSAIELARIHSLYKWLLKRGDTCYGFRTKDGILKEIARLSYTPVAISAL